MDRTNMPSPKGLGYTGGDLFQLALAGCFTGNLVGEAEKRGISLKHVDVDIETDWGANDARAESISFSVKVEAHASDEEIQDLIKWANMESTITQTVKTGVPITLSSIAATITA